MLRCSLFWKWAQRLTPITTCLRAHLNISYGISGPSLDGLHSFLDGQTLMCSDHSAYVPVPFSIPQGSAYGLLPYNLYKADLTQFITAAVCWWRSAVYLICLPSNACLFRSTVMGVIKSASDEPGPKHSTYVRTWSKMIRSTSSIQYPARSGFPGWITLLVVVHDGMCFLDS